MAELMWTGLLIAAPLLVAALVVGLLISVLQVVTQIQELSLTFVPKVVVAVIVLVAAGPWMLRRLLAYASGVISSIPSYL